MLQFSGNASALNQIAETPTQVTNTITVYSNYLVDTIEIFF